ncbi:MAG: prephenate dehydrogenase/arogenate dehydrogenase family protein [Methanospirillum sp.]|nr:prephenate dehydrogenase/arogenate dehydrogenase family protein [Methanospirillum sp.]
MIAGIIGGTGGMGSLFSRVFREEGYDVLVCGRSTKVTKEDIAREADIVMVSVPIRDTIPVIDAISSLLSEDQILTDLTSLKTRPVQAMLRSKSRVIGLHPMFGPTAGTIRGQTIVATPARCRDEDISLFTSLFESQGARVTLTTPEEHDRIMAVIQGLTHFKAILLAGTMRRLGISPEDTEMYMSPVYRIETGIAGRVLAQDPELYSDILCMNPSVPWVLDTCRQAADEIRKMIADNDTKAFRSEFLVSREWFGHFCQQAQEETDFLIHAMVNR